MFCLIHVTLKNNCLAWHTSYYHIFYRYTHLHTLYQSYPIHSKYRNKNSKYRSRDYDPPPSGDTYYWRNHPRVYTRAQSGRLVVCRSSFWRQLTRPMYYNPHILVYIHYFCYHSTLMSHAGIHTGMVTRVTTMILDVIVFVIVI